jgi:hypothetical protein
MARHAHCASGIRRRRSRKGSIGTIVLRIVKEYEAVWQIRADAYHQARSAYRAAPFRPPAFAGRVYPRQPQALRAQLEGWLGPMTE